MRTRSLTQLIVLVLLGCGEKHARYEEVPENIIPGKVCPTLYSRIMEMFPEAVNNQEQYPSLFSDTVRKTIVLTKETEVYAKFVSEHASIASTLGWYAYDQAKPPKSKSDIKVEVLFPKITNSGLKPGDILQLGTQKFKAGTVIGFVLIVGGWRDGFIDFSKPSHYTDYSWNDYKTQQHVLFRENNCGDIVFCLEDRPIVEGKSDADFNDIIFAVSDNSEELQTVSFDDAGITSM